MEDNLPEVIGLFRCESEGDIKWSDDLTNSLAVYTRTPAKQSTLDLSSASISVARDLLKQVGIEAAFFDDAVGMACAEIVKLRKREQKQSTPEELRHDIDRVNKHIEYALTSVNGDKFEIAKAIENIIHHATRAVEAFYLANPKAARGKQLRSALTSVLMTVAVFITLLVIGASIGWAIFLSFVSLAAMLVAANQWDANEATLDTAEHLRAAREEKKEQSCDQE